MNKISKKIVSLVTTAAFVTTLVPAAAFGATFADQMATVEFSNGATEQQVVLDQDRNGDAVSITANINDGWETGDQLGFWIGSEKQAATSQPSYSATKSGATSQQLTEWGTSDTYWITSVAAGDKYTIDVDFDGMQPNTYKLYTAIWETSDGSPIDYDKLDIQEVGTITVINASSVVDADDSQLLIDGNHSGDATQNKAVAFSFNVLNNDGTPSDYALNANGGDVYVWAEYADGTIVNDATFAQVMKADGTTPAYDISAEPVDGQKGIWKVTGSVNDTDELNVTIPKAGEGIVVKSVVAPTGKTPKVVANNKVEVPANSATLTPITLNVEAATVDVAKIEFNSVTGVTGAPTPNADNTVWYAEISDDVTPSATKVYTVKGKALDAKGAAVENEKFYVTVDDNNMKLQGLDEDGTVTTNALGDFSFKFTIASDGKYSIKLSEVDGTASATLIVKQGDVDAVAISKVKDGGYVLAGTDRNYAADVFSGKVYLSDAVQFAITDAYGRDAVGPGPITDEWAAKQGDNHADSLTVVNQPKGGKLTSDDFILAWDEDAGVYTLEYKGDAKDLIAGEYSVRVALNNGGKNAVTVNFTAAEFGDVEDLVLDMSASEKQWWAGTAQDNAITAIDDQVALGQWVKVTPKYVDANGLKVKANVKNMQVGINGDAVAARDINNSTIGFATAANTAANNAYVGSIITVKVNDPATNLYVEKELTVVKNYLGETVSIDPTQGAVGEANTVTVSVVDEDGNVSKVNGKLSASIVSQSDETATVDLKVNPQVKNGQARMYLESDKAGTADVRVVVEASNGELYAGTFTYTFGDEDPYAGRTVVMTIGSADYIINNKVVEGDAAPYIDSAWRTMVPVRVLAESFGADVDYTDGVVTIVDGDTTIVMNVGEDTYTINDEEQTMDTAPVIGAGDRTYVPVRFVAEGLGYEVTPLYDVENGTTASVAFQK